MAGDQVHAFHHNLVLLGQGGKDLALMGVHVLVLTAVAGDADDRVALFDIHCHFLCPPQITSGARDRIFI